MGKSIQFRNFVSDNGDVTRFSSIQFRRCADEYISEKINNIGEKYTKSKFDEDVANELHYTADTIKNWRLGKNGPGDFAVIRKLASFMGIDYHDLLVNENEEPVTAIDDDKFRIESNDEKDIIMHMYQLFVDYIYWFTGTIGKTKADLLLEWPGHEQYEYISDLYYLLDRLALNISEEVYNALRKTVTELDLIPACRMRYTVYLPKAWTDINPFLLKREFDALLAPEDYVVYDYPVNHSADFVDLVGAEYEDENGVKHLGDELGHLFFEDIPDYHDIAENLRQETMTHKIVIDPDTNEEVEISEPYYAPNCSDLSILLCEPIIDDFDPNILVCREFANTLIKLMKKRFPQCFGNL